MHSFGVICKFRFSLKGKSSQKIFRAHVTFYRRRPSILLVL
ncbi:hypothetical protein KNP414_04009 [Paenibacillus mucilaginosus KNP414]|uniref:Uncharacterized protein n=1 Tax=Paenibacillus mucilaginosus (strain KNP414) TaxID=1036673 RepID=F8FBH6_PAEMK|nr:hypothetical protein KNP414_04009 [Paenibacillus mucilaginosus KNP414]